MLWRLESHIIIAIQVVVTGGEYRPRVAFTGDNGKIEAYALEVPLGLVRLCYHKGDIDFEMCCAPEYGPGGNPACWDSVDNVQDCCSAAQQQLHETDAFPREKVLHNAYRSTVLDKDPRWFSFLFETTSVCPDFYGAPKLHGRDVFSGLPELEYEEIAMLIQSKMQQEDKVTLWTHVRAACLISTGFALTLWSAAVQAKVGVRPVHESFEYANLADLHFRRSMHNILQQMGRSSMLVDARGYPLLPSQDAVTIWQDWMLVPFQNSELTAESLFHAAQTFHEHLKAAFWATEDFYFGRLRPRLLEGCAGICDTSLQTRSDSDFWIPFYHATVDCPALMGNLQLGRNANLWPPPRSVPAVFAEDFRRGDVAIFPRYHDEGQTETLKPESKRCQMWSRESLEDLRNIIRNVDGEALQWPAFDNQYVGYDTAELNGTARFIASVKDAIPFLGSAIGGHWLVLGSHTPWIEAVLLELQIASQVTTVEYAPLSSCPNLHPRVTPILPSEFNQQYLGEERFDGFVQWSSIEHSGLGMYGDEINPWADRQTIAQLWCRGKEGARFVYGPGPEGPGGSVWGRTLHNENRAGQHSGSLYEEKIYWNAGRDYGAEMTGRLMLNWKLLRPARDTWSSHVFQRMEAAK